MGGTTTNPYDNSEEYPSRDKDKPFIFDDETREKKLRDCDKPITEETLVQRNIYLNEKNYCSELGRLIGYEVSFVRKNRCIPIDLLAVEIGEKITFNIIELKMCEINIEPKVKAAKDLLIRALFEVSTYRQFVKYSILDNDYFAKQVQEQIYKVTGKVTSYEDIKSADTTITIIGPEEMIKEKDEDYFKDFDLSGAQFYTISPNDKFKSNNRVNTREKIFDITKA